MPAAPRSLRRSRLHLPDSAIAPRLLVVIPLLLQRNYYYYWHSAAAAAKGGAAPRGRPFDSHYYCTPESMMVRAENSRAIGRDVARRAPRGAFYSTGRTDVDCTVLVGPSKIAGNGKGQQWPTTPARAR